MLAHRAVSASGFTFSATLQISRAHMLHVPQARRSDMRSSRSTTSFDEMHWPAGNYNRTPSRPIGPQYSGLSNIWTTIVLGTQSEVADLRVSMVQIVCSCTADTTKAPFALDPLLFISSLTQDSQSHPHSTKFSATAAMSASSLGKRPHRNPAPATKLADANNTE